MKPPIFRRFRFSAMHSEAMNGRNHGILILRCRNMKKKQFTELVEDGSLTVPNILLRNYADLGLSEKEFVLLLHVHSHIQKGNAFPTPTELSDHMTITTAECVKLLRSLVQRGFLTIEEFEQNGMIYEKYSLKQLWEKLYDVVVMDQDQEKVEKENQLYTIFEQEFGRPLSPIECETLAFWVDQDHHDPDIIISALREAVISGKLNFRYIDRILFEWKKNGIKTIEQAKKHSQKFHEFNQKQKQSTQGEQEYKRKVPFYNWLEN